MHEEAGLVVAASSLYSIRHKAKQPDAPDARDFYKLFFLCERLDAQEPRPGTETTDVGFFSLERLPPLSLGRVIQSDIQAAFAFQDSSMRLTTFD
jgi:ADP-ribose pyrophosphatase YjhB (NUDIX family)